jgi:hypothetical protein
MTFGRKGIVTGEIDVSGAAHLLQGSREFLRMWHRPGGEATCLVDPAALNPDPAAFGIALVDCVRHGARAWANATGISESDALARIWLGLDAERENPTDLGKEMH